MIQAQTISVTLKTEIQQRIDDTVIAILHLKTNTPQRTIKKWLQEASSKLTHYSFLIALSEIFSTPHPNPHRRPPARGGVLQTPSNQTQTEHEANT